MPLAKTRGPKYGKCNICGDDADLTSDHVPPKGVLKFNRVDLHNIAVALSAEETGPIKGRFFQRGVKFRSICQNCNRDLLGALYDPELVSFSNDVSRYLTSQLTLPAIAKFSVRPGLIAKAIAGHILAIGLERFPRGVMGDALAEFVRDPDSAPPDGLSIFYWPYPYWSQVLIRGFGIGINWGSPCVVASVIKFWPMAYMITYNHDQRIRFFHMDLCKFIVGAGQSKVELPVRLTNIPAEHYPEAPDESGIRLHGEDSYYVRRR